LRIDWADACSLGRNGERYFLLVVDKDTEYSANFNTKSRHNPVELLRAYVNTTGKRPTYLRVDGAKEFVSDDIVEYCVQNHIIFQTVVAYNHTMQARVEGAIGYVKQHSRVAMLYPHGSGHGLLLTLYTKRITPGTPKIRLESGQRRTSA
jgi:hypothetical protein